MEMGLVQKMETGSARAMESRGRGRPERTAYAEYLLVIYPHGELEERLMEAQQQFSSDYGPDQGQRNVRNKPHIALATFQAGEEAEDTLIRWIHRICQQHRSFQLALNNYSGIPPHTTRPPEAAESITGTIYLRVQDPEPLLRLVQQLDAIDEFIRSSGWPPVRQSFMTTGRRRPYLPIAGGLTEQIYNKAMPDYSRKTFHGNFRVEELVLLRRKHSFDPCKTVNIFGLKS